MKKLELKPRLTLQHILDQHLELLIEEGLFNSYQSRILRALRACKTSALGEHWEACDHCGVLKVHYNSCGNRHCPGCQGAKREKWLLEREQDLFDVPHHHLTFTVPQQLRIWFKMNQKKLYDLLFTSMWETLLSFSQDPRSRLEAQIGVISILHTWTQKLEYHPHLHCIVPSGGLLANGEWKVKSGRYLFHVPSVSVVFKNKFCDGLGKLYRKGSLRFRQELSPHEFSRFIQHIKRMKWGVNSKAGFNGKASVLEYLGRYTHKIAISNYRLLKLDNDQVTFTYRDRRAGDIKKVMSLPVRKFLLRFAQHILPRRFVKIRHYGFLSTRVKKVKLPKIREALNQPPAAKKEKLTVADVIKQTTGKDITLCSSCKEGRMRTIKIIPRPRGSPSKLINPKIETKRYID